MTDTGFYVSPQKALRYAKPLAIDPLSGKPQKVSPDLTQKIGFDCGGGCAASTASDYLRFALMLLNKGRFDDQEILSRKTVEYMLSNQLSPQVTNLIGNADPTRADFGFGLGLAVRTTPGVVRLMGSVGMFTWPGASGTDWWVDPAEDLAVVYLSAAPGPARWAYRQKINALVYQALQ
jgi:CubicO group peptidase (beta-lactamase class C family)